MKNTITFIGKFDENLLQLEEEVLNIGNQSKTPEKLRDKIDENFDINSINPTVDKHEIKEYNCDLWVTLGNVKPTVLLKSLISRSNIVILVFNLEEPDTLKFLNNGWLPIFEQIKIKHENQEVLLFGTGNESVNDEFIEEIQKTINNFNCTKYFEWEHTSKDKYKTKNTTINISKKIIQYLKKKLEPIEISKREDDNDNYITNHEEEEEEIDEKTKNESNNFENDFSSNINLYENIEKKDEEEEEEEVLELNKKGKENDDDQIYEIFKDENKVNYKLSKTKLTAAIIKSPEVKDDVFIPTYIEFESNQYIIIRVCDFSFEQSKIKSLSFSENSKVKYFGSSIFKNSTIQKIFIPPFLCEINEHWIDDANKLELIDVVKKNQYIENNDGFIFYKKVDKNGTKHCKIIFSPPNFKGEYIVPKETTCIGRCVFHKCKGIKSFKSDGSSLRIIKSYGFYKCENLENFIFTSNSELILCGFCFSNSPKLSSVNISCKTLKIGIECFSNCESLSTFLLSAKKDVIFSRGSFKKCNNLENIIVLNADTIKIGDECFSKAVKLKSAAFTANSIFFGNNFFNECESLSYVAIKSQNDINISSNTFKNCYLTTIKLITSAKLKLEEKCFTNELYQLQSIELEGRYIIIGKECFNNCPLLSSFSIKRSGNIEIHENEFINCDKLESIYIESNIENEQGRSYQINFYPKCFNQLKALKNILIQGGDVRISKSSFIDCFSLQSVSIKQASNVCIEQSQFLNYKSFKIISIESNSSISLKQNCFNGCISLETIDIYGKLIFIGDDCFSNCTNIKKVVISKVHELSVGVKAFLNCSQLEKVEFKAKKKIIIKNNCFGDTKVETAYFQGNIVEIGNNCFEVSSFWTSPKIKAVNIECERLIIDDRCFQKCTSLKTFSVLNAKEIELRKNAFEKCKSIENISLNAEKYLMIDDNCFSEARKLKTLEFNSKKVTIGTKSFYKCSIDLIKSLESDTVILGERSFNSCFDLKEINIKANSEFQAGYYCFDSLKNLQTIQIISNNIKIGDFSFYNCMSIKTVSFPVVIYYESYTSSFYPIAQKKINFIISLNARKKMNKSEELEQMKSSFQDGLGLICS